MNEENFRSFASWVRREHESQCYSASRNAERLSKNLASLSVSAEAGNPSTDHGSLWLSTIADLESAQMMTKVLWWVEYIEEKEDN